MQNKWSDEDILLIKNMLDDKKSFSQIAKATHRTLHAVKYKFRNMYRKKCRKHVISNNENSCVSDTSNTSDTLESIDDDPNIYNMHNRSKQFINLRSNVEEFHSRYDIVIYVYMICFTTFVGTGVYRYVDVLFESLNTINNTIGTYV